MCFLMAMEEEPLRSWRAVMALMISALYDMMMIVQSMMKMNGRQTQYKFRHGVAGQKWIK